MTIKPIVEAVAFSLAEMQYGRGVRKFVLAWHPRAGLQFVPR